MSGWLLPRDRDPVDRTDRPITISVDGEPVTGIEGQSVAGMLLAAGRTSWRTTRSGAPRGVFCGIGACFDCLLTVNDVPDVRACRRPAADGDEVRTQSREETA
ncbi:proline dehydrogenase [Amycolatopsis sp. WAC 04169]|uniref:(2Fe-2S)-binding protein n=1 Tax=Amycolatopsis sp. WAC 04169 TaxID=2203197 RepID=UPI000F78EB73|nr:(2Fe-2S)-binding protein [Amycolatopsis sp. WAC 04169]RSN28832.1 proline dehydrogenase [Amycolatopsis sp. WAC 04169]